ncbi:MAG: GNAT family N-acetyltransferase [Butyrivibrio sp.]
MGIHLTELNKDNWLEAVNLSVSEEQKNIFPIPNTYWLGISRYEEKTTLYAIMSDEIIVGLIGLGYDEDGISGFINPLMIDAKYQGNRYAEQAMEMAINILKKDYNAAHINLGHRKENIAAGKLYEKLGFEIVGEDEQDYFRTKKL